MAQADLRGDITDTGGEDADERGFVWDTTSQSDPGDTSPTNSSYSSSWTETGTFGTGNFSNTETGLTEGTTYYYRAGAHNSAGWSYGSESSFTTPPAAPSNLSASVVSGDQIDLAWTDNSSNEDGFYVYRAQASGTTTDDYTQVADLAADTTSYSDTGLEDGEQYFYRVASYTSSDESLSGEVSATTTLPAPTSLSVTGNDMSWTDNSTGEDGFYIYRSTTSGSTTGDYTQIDSVGTNTTTYTDSGSNEDTRYYYRVTAYTSHTESDVSNEDDAKWMTRSAEINGDGQIDITRGSSLTMSRSATIQGDGQIAVTRSVSMARTATVEGDGQTDTTRDGLSLPRLVTIDGDGQTDVTRDDVTMARSATTQGDGQIDIVGGDLSADRSVTIEQHDGEIGVSRSTVTMGRSTTIDVTGTQTEVVANFADVLIDGFDDRTVSYDGTKNAFVTEWINEWQWGTGETLGLRVVSAVETDPIHVKIERDDIGNGTVDAESDWVEVTASDTPITFPEISDGEAYYRILLRYIRRDDFVTGVDLGWVR